MKKIIIIGSSIAGASAALALAGEAEINVYEKKKREDVGKKTCANVVTESFVKYCRELGLIPEKFIVSKFSKAFFVSKNRKISLKTNEFRIDRIKFLDNAVKNAEKKVNFNFETEFIDFRRENNSFAVRLKKNSKEFEERADILIGADGAMSRVAEKSGLKNRELWLCIQAVVPVKKLDFEIDKKAYYIFTERRFGYYSYIFPCNNNVVIGAGDKLGRAEKEFKEFLKFLKVKPEKIQAALIPFPEKIHFKDNLFFIGDAACSVKFSGGGIIPAMVDAISVRDIILKKDYKNYNMAKKRVMMNKIVAKVMSRMSDNSFDRLLDIIKDEKFSDILKKRDEFGRKEYSKMFDLRFLRFLLKLI